MPSVEHPNKLVKSLTIHVLKHLDSLGASEHCTFVLFLVAESVIANSIYVALLAKAVVANSLYAADASKSSTHLLCFLACAI